MNYGMLAKATLKTTLWAIGGVLVLAGGMFAVEMLKAVQSPWLGHIAVILVLIIVFIMSVWEKYKKMMAKKARDYSHLEDKYWDPPL